MIYKVNSLYLLIIIATLIFSSLRGKIENFDEAIQ
ncbi:hypothetical protein BTU51_0639 [Rickettsia rickettsii]|uniref:Uncharacterized protein n=1 Tax=Rickettsia rickettsii (strain Iowa) TaxID=452659 RepID=B0BXC7_RICRO|nr:hypothetical protein RrIowa_0639 [Rickettsia rickettsii str. Iowa]APU55455.1 hypothetical protein BTU50_0639 [Rickettsia rickettsii]APU56832.1 hypothetical protein BTU51_0639 [Rickettsia rickettsii]